MPAQKTIGQLDFDEVRCLSVPLAEKLDAYVQRHWQHQRTIALLYESLVERLATGGAGRGALVEGQRLPPFILPNSDGRLVRSEELLENGPLVVSFNRGHWCPFCRLELLALAEIYPDVKKLGAELISIMPEKEIYARTLKETFDIGFPVLSDIDNGYTLANGLMISFGSDLRQALLEKNINLAAFHGSSGLFMPIPATYVVAQGGIVKHGYVNPDFRERIKPDQVISVLKSL